MTQIDQGPMSHLKDTVIQEEPSRLSTQGYSNGLSLDQHPTLSQSCKPTDGRCFTYSMLWTKAETSETIAKPITIYLVLIMVNAITILHIYRRSALHLQNTVNQGGGMGISAQAYVNRVSFDQWPMLSQWPPNNSGLPAADTIPTEDGNGCSTDTWCYPSGVHIAGGRLYRDVSHRHLGFLNGRLYHPLSLVDTILIAPQVYYPYQYLPL